jgi:hypothetical protein
MIKRREGHETRDAGRNHQAEKYFPEEPDAKPLAETAGSNLATQPPKLAHAGIGKHDRQSPDRRCVGGETHRRPQNKTAPGSLIWLARVGQQ